MTIRPLLGSLLAAVLLVADASAQPCAGTTFWKNDALPANPAGVVWSVIQGLCPGEAAGSVFDFPAGKAPQRLREVSVGFGHITGGVGFSAVVDLEIYLGPVTTTGPNGAIALGPKIFDYGDATAGSIQITTNGLNVVDLTPFDVVVDDDFVVVFQMDFNSNGNCSSGYAANFTTDNGSPGGGGCNPGKNVMFIQGQGWRDPALAKISIFNLCPQFYAGNWAIRACSDDASGPWADLGGGTPGVNGVPQLTGLGPLTPGSQLGLQLVQGPPSDFILLWISLTSAPMPIFGGTLHAIPFDAQELLFTDGAGAFGASVALPLLPPGTDLWFQFLCKDDSVIYGITLSNAVLGTTQ